MTSMQLHFQSVMLKNEGLYQLNMAVALFVLLSPFPCVPSHCLPLLNFVFLFHFRFRLTV